MRTFLLFCLLTADVVASMWAIVRAVQLSRLHVRCHLLRAVTYALGWLLLIWPFTILLAYAEPMPINEYVAPIYLISILAILLGALLIGAHYAVRFIAGKRALTQQSSATSSSRVADFIHWLGLTVLIAAIAISPKLTGRMVWVGYIGAFVGVCAIAGAYIFKRYQQAKSSTHEQ